MIDLTLERDRLANALVTLTTEMAQLLAPKRLGAAHRSTALRSDGAPDAFHEPGAEDPYPLNAAEDRFAYHQWLVEHHRPTSVGAVAESTLPKPATRAPRGQTPLISVVVPLYRTPIWALRRCVASVLAQRFAGFELLLCDDASDDDELTGELRRIARHDRRITVTSLASNSGISAATNAAVALAHGRFIAFLDHDDELAPDALEKMAEAIEHHPQAEFLYSDEDKIDANGERFDPLFKPDWSPDLLTSFAYTCHLTLIAKELFDRIGGLRSEYDGSQDYDLALLAGEMATEIVHVAEVLYHWRTLPGSAATDRTGAVAKPWAYQAGMRALTDALARRGEPGCVEEDPRYPGRYRLHRTVIGNPRVSIIIPFRDEPAILATCVRTMREAPGHDNLEFVLVDNNSELPETRALLDQLRLDDDVIVTSYPHPFNWSAVNNFGAAKATGEILLFSNNDIEARQPGWLRALVSEAQRKEVGVVGAKLLYPDGTIQHAGVVIGLGGIAGHLLRGLPDDRPGYNSTAISTRNCSVVTGATLMTRRAVFDLVGGFNEELPVAFNDVDFCLKVREHQLLVVFTPLAELIHHESRSRGHTDDLAEHATFVARWADAILAGDPYLNKNLSHWRYWCPLSTPQEDYRWKTYLEQTILMHSSSSTV